MEAAPARPNKITEKYSGAPAGRFSRFSRFFNRSGRAKNRSTLDSSNESGIEPAENPSINRRKTVAAAFPGYLEDHPNRRCPAIRKTHTRRFRNCRIGEQYTLYLPHPPILVIRTGRLRAASSAPLQAETITDLRSNASAALSSRRAVTSPRLRLRSGGTIIRKSRSVRRSWTCGSRPGAPPDRL
jgi:hypothetical protein